MLRKILSGVLLVVWLFPTISAADVTFVWISGSCSPGGLGGATLYGT